MSGAAKSTLGAMAQGVGRGIRWPHENTTLEHSAPGCPTTESGDPVVFCGLQSADWCGHRSVGGVVCDVANKLMVLAAKHVEESTSTDVAGKILTRANHENRRPL